MRKQYKDKCEVLNVPAFNVPQCGGIGLLDVSLRTAEPLFTAALRPEWVIATARVTAAGQAAGLTKGSR